MMPADGGIKERRGWHRPRGTDLETLKSIAQFRGSKADIWEGGHRVPFLVRWPGHPEVVARLTQLLEQCVANGRSTPGAKQPNDTKLDLRNTSATMPSE